MEEEQREQSWPPACNPPGAEITAIPTQLCGRFLLWFGFRGGSPFNGLVVTLSDLELLLSLELAVDSTGCGVLRVQRVPAICMPFN